MSRIGKQPILLPKEVKCTVGKDAKVIITGPKGVLNQFIHSAITVVVEG